MNHDRTPLKSIPEETYQAARRIYNLENVYLKIGDHLEEILSGIQVEYLDPTSSLGNERVIHTALVTAFQYAEALPDLAASEAILKRMDWKYALRLPLRHVGIAAVALCHFRQNLKDAPKAIEQFDQLLQALGKAGLFARIASHPLDPLAVLFSISMLTRYSLLHQGMKNALSVLVSSAPDWVRRHAAPHWYEHYSADHMEASQPGNTGISVEQANTLGTDISMLLEGLRQEKLTDILDRPEIKSLSRLWEEQYRIFGDDVQWRLPGCLHCSSYRQGIFR